MALSIPPPPPPLWERTLPNPADLLSSTVDPRRSSSLLQHHISSAQFLTPAAGETGRRNTVASLSRFEAHEESSHGEEDYLRRRQDSVMSGESVTELSSEGASPPETSSGYCLCAPDPKIPRPRNAFILYRQNQHADVVKAHPGLPNPDISKIIGEQWRRLSPDEKDKWKAFAEQEKVRHSQKFPDYRYRPKRSGKYQSSNENSQSASQTANCPKCGGKTMNPPHTPHYSSFENSSSAVSMSRPQKRAYPETHMQPRAPSLVQVAAPPYATPVRYSFQPRHDSIHYAPPPSHHPQLHPHHAPQHGIEGPEIKRRRLESQYTSRPPYEHQYFDRQRNSYVHPEHPARHPMPPPRLSDVPGASTGSRSLQSPQARRDVSLILPPLKTGIPPRSASTSSKRFQQADVEAMILSYPILTKLKTLQSITPILTTSGTTSLTHQGRGAIIAIEGLDHKKVLDMTQSLADQLEKQGTFLVRIFNGPNPSQALQASRRVRASIQEEGVDELMTTAKYLDIISAWHKINKVMIDFITGKQDEIEEDTDCDMTDTIVVEEPIPRSQFDQEVTKRSPISAISPKTIEQTASMTIEAPDGATNEAVIPRVTRSRIPQAALDRQAKENDVKNLPPPTPPSPSAEQARNFSNEASPSPTNHSLSSNLIPIALVPHYQLTTVDTCSVALPITDNYDPLTHWRWHATLWRGCVGPDVSIVVKSPHEQYEEETASTSMSSTAEVKKIGDLNDHRRTGSVIGAASTTSNIEQAPPSGVPPIPAAPHAQTAPVPAPFGVEVRLQDHRAVIIRATGSGRGSNASEQNGNKDYEKEKEKENENWEKAKRRVGFEVEEWLRR